MNIRKTSVAAAGLALVAGLAVTGSAQAATYTKTTVAQHSTTSDCWTIIGRGVYDVTSYIPRHPGGPGQIASICGRVGTGAFNGEHGGSSSVKRLLATYKIGTVRR